MGWKACPTVVCGLLLTGWKACLTVVCGLLLTGWKARPTVVCGLLLTGWEARPTVVCGLLLTGWEALLRLSAVCRLHALIRFPRKFVSHLFAVRLLTFLSPVL